LCEIACLNFLLDCGFSVESVVFQNASATTHNTSTVDITLSPCSI
jgi:hypothetical protein